MEDTITTRKHSRRHFLSRITYGAGGLVLLGSYGFSITRDNKNGVIRAISVDFEKCTGCRTCESVCSEYNNRVMVNGEMLNGLSNPARSNIRVYHFNPDVDIPSTCALCEDAPCIEACPVEPDPVTGRKALYRDDKLHTIVNDPIRCIGCQSCAIACAEKRAGVIHPDPETGNPMFMCTLCGGDPQCVKHCPYDALKYMEMPADRDLDKLAPEKLAQIMIDKFYNV
ncbi:MAG TPA: FeS-binding protein [Bacteroidales bacterium]|nr:FeS-binding protein [Bacteroidales bacterium]